MKVKIPLCQYSLLLRKLRCNLFSKKALTIFHDFKANTLLKLLFREDSAGRITLVINNVTLYLILRTLNKPLCSVDKV